MDGYAHDSSKGTQKGGECEPLIPLYYLLDGHSLFAYPSASGLDTISASGLIGHQARSHHDHPSSTVGGRGYEGRILSERSTLPGDSYSPLLYVLAYNNSQFTTTSGPLVSPS